MESFLPLLKNIEAMTSSRDRDKLLLAFLCIINDVVGDKVCFSIFYRDTFGEISFVDYADHAVGDASISAWRDCVDEAYSVAGNIYLDFDSPWRDFFEEACTAQQLIVRRIFEHNCGAVPLPSSKIASGQIILVFDADQRNISDYAPAIEWVIGIYKNQNKLLDYAELDGLTGLLNRKTFDERFDRLLTATYEKDNRIIMPERRSVENQEEPAWLGVIDIDHFKRINDGYGHLFGDEVLKRMGDLLRKSFRYGDRLFRFGGEEFVVILNAPSQEQADIGFNRFRRTFENHEFPRVGKVTCSIGYTEVLPIDVPPTAVGRADDALYLAKNHGRNIVYCYEQLIDAGLLTPENHEQLTVVDGCDIDALFD